MEKSIVLETPQIDWSLTMLGRICNSRVVLQWEFINFVRADWNLANTPMISHYKKNEKKNMFILKFHNASDFYKVKEFKPWYIKGDLIALKVIPETGIPNDGTMELTEEIFWLKAVDVPIQYISEKGLTKVVRSAGKYQKHDPPFGNNMLEKDVMVQVMVDLKKKIAKEMVTRSEDGEKNKISFEFDTLLRNLCTNCRIIDHSDIPCEGRRQCLNPVLHGGEKGSTSRGHITTNEMPNIEREKGAENSQKTVAMVEKKGVQNQNLLVDDGGMEELEYASKGVGGNGVNGVESPVSHEIMMAERNNQLQNEGEKTQEGGKNEQGKLTVAQKSKAKKVYKEKPNFQKFILDPSMVNKGISIRESSKVENFNTTNFTDLLNTPSYPLNFFQQKPPEKKQNTKEPLQIPTSDATGKKKGTKTNQKKAYAPKSRSKLMKEQMEKVVTNGNCKMKLSLYKDNSLY